MMYRTKTLMTGLAFAIPATIGTIGLTAQTATAQSPGQTPAVTSTNISGLQTDTTETRRGCERCKWTRKCDHRGHCERYKYCWWDKTC